MHSSGRRFGAGSRRCGASERASEQRRVEASLNKRRTLNQRGRVGAKSITLSAPLPASVGPSLVRLAGQARIMRRRRAEGRPGFSWPAGRLIERAPEWACDLSAGGQIGASATDLRGARARALLIRAAAQLSAIVRRARTIDLVRALAHVRTNPSANEPPGRLTGLTLAHLRPLSRAGGSRAATWPT